MEVVARARRRCERRRGARTCIESGRAEPAREALGRLVVERAVRPLAVAVLTPRPDEPATYAEIDKVTISRRLGHASADIALRCYSRVFTKADAHDS